MPLRFFCHPRVFGPLFSAPSWEPWHTALSVLDGHGSELPSERQAWARERLGFAPGAALPETPAREAWLVCGRRAGKSHIAALMAVAANDGLWR